MAVYFVSDGGNSIKIGFSSNVKKRLSYLSLANPRASLIGQVPGTIQQERALHKSLSEYRTVGEWFRDCIVVREAINEVLRIGFLPVAADRATHDPDQWTLQAQEMGAYILKYAEIVMGEGAKKHLHKIDDHFGLRENTLWRLRYRPNKELYASQYFEIIDAAHRAALAAQQQINADLEKISTIIRGHPEPGMREGFLAEATAAIALLRAERNAAAGDEKISA